MVAAKPRQTWSRALRSAGAVVSSTRWRIARSPSKMETTRSSARMTACAPLFGIHSSVLAGPPGIVATGTGSENPARGFARPAAPAPYCGARSRLPTRRRHYRPVASHQRTGHNVSITQDQGLMFRRCHTRYGPDAHRFRGWASGRGRGPRSWNRGTGLAHVGTPQGRVALSVRPSLPNPAGRWPLPARRSRASGRVGRSLRAGSLAGEGRRLTKPARLSNANPPRSPYSAATKPASPLL